MDLDILTQYKNPFNTKTPIPTTTGTQNKRKPHVAKPTKPQASPNSSSSLPSDQVKPAKTLQLFHKPTFEHKASLHEDLLPGSMHDDFENPSFINGLITKRQGPLQQIRSLPTLSDTYFRSNFGELSHRPPVQSNWVKNSPLCIDNFSEIWREERPHTMTGGLLSDKRNKKVTFAVGLQEVVENEENKVIPPAEISPRRRLAILHVHDKNHKSSPSPDKLSHQSSPSPHKITLKPLVDTLEHVTPGDILFKTKSLASSRRSSRSEEPVLNEKKTKEKSPKEKDPDKEFRSNFTGPFGMCNHVGKVLIANNPKISQRRLLRIKKNPIKIFLQKESTGAQKEASGQSPEIIWPASSRLIVGPQLRRGSSMGDDRNEKEGLKFELGLGAVSHRYLSQAQENGFNLNQNTSDPRHYLRPPSSSFKKHH